MATKKSAMLVIRAARPSFRNCHDKAAFAVHAAFIAAGYILHSTGLPAFGERVLTSCQVTDEVGIENWNGVEDLYAFLYSHPQQGSKRVLMRSHALNEILYVEVLKEGDSESSHRLQVNTMEYVENAGGGNYASQFKNLAKLVADVNKEILSKLDGSSISTAAPPNQLNLSTARNIDFLLELLHVCRVPPLPEILGSPNPWHFNGRPVSGTMPNGPYPRFWVGPGIWRPRPQTPTFPMDRNGSSIFDMAPRGRLRDRRPETRSHSRNL